LVLTIAGFDPTSGAGVTADIKTISANQAYGLACVTALTVQNTLGTRGFRAIPAGVLEEQLEFLLEDVSPRAIKIGMLGGKDTVEVVARQLSRQLERNPAPWIVLDPIHTSTNGVRLSDDTGWAHMRKRLFPLVTVLTPNIPEAALLTGVPVESIAKPSDMEKACAALHAMLAGNGSPKFVVLKGGHLDRPLDLLYDGSKFTPFPGDRVRNGNTHGTGCTFSAALAANLACGKQVADAVVMAKAYLTAALKQAYPIGQGGGGLNHLYRLQESPTSRNVDPAPHTEFTTR